MNTLEMIAGILVGGFIAFVIANLFIGRTMTVVLGQRFKTQAGLIRAVFAPLRMYWFAYSNTLFVNPNCTVKTGHENREMRKNRPTKSVMIFEVEL